MASLKEIKVRIASIRSTQKITSAMKMVSSAKLHHAQAAIEQMLVYEQKLTGILNGVLSTDDELNSPYTIQREVKQVAIVAFSSNTGLCGTFNANVWKELSVRIHQYEADNKSVLLYPVGKKIAESLQKAGYQINGQFLHLGDKPSYGETSQLADELISLFDSGQADHIELLYHHFKNRAEQVITYKTFLPVILPKTNIADIVSDYITEPSSGQLLALLLPRVLHISIYAALLDTQTAEHAARMLAMQTANDNANDITQKLTLQYNKTRQQAITNELLDIMGGAGTKS